VLLSNLEEFHPLGGRGGHLPDRDSADREEAAPARAHRRRDGFFGGADSAFTAWRHRRGQPGRQGRDLQAGVLVHGFDIPLGQEGVFARAAGRAREMLASLGMDLIPVATNFREQGGRWEHTYGTGLVSCLMLLQGRFREGLV
jgi:hypothetical protein